MTLSAELARFSACTSAPATAGGVIWTLGRAWDALRARRKAARP